MCEVVVEAVLSGVRCGCVYLLTMHHQVAEESDGQSVFHYQLSGAFGS
jgi:hypothetical protein